MNLELAEPILRKSGGILAYITLEVIFLGIWRGILRKAGRARWLPSRT